MNRPYSPIYRTKTIFNHVSFGFVFRKIRRALFSWNTRFEVRPFSLLPTKWLILLQIWDDTRHHAKFWIRPSKSWNHVRKSAWIWKSFQTYAESSRAVKFWLIVSFYYFRFIIQYFRKYIYICFLKSTVTPALFITLFM